MAPWDAKKEILGPSLPTYGDILRNFMYHDSERLSISESEKHTVDAAGSWAKARIPTQLSDSAVRKLRKSYDVCRFKEKQFSTDLSETVPAYATGGSIQLQRDQITSEREACTKVRYKCIAARKRKHEMSSISSANELGSAIPSQLLPVNNRLHQIHIISW